MTGSPQLQQVELGWSESAILERCRVLRSTLEARRVPAPELAALAPGGARNQVADPYGAAVTSWALLRARWEQEEVKRQDDEARAEAAVAAALGRKPVAVVLVGAIDEARAVYPKSYHALEFLDGLDRSLSDVVAAATELEALDVRALAPLTRSLAVRLWAWILTDPSEGLPFDEMRPPEPPAWTQRLEAEDLMTILGAHVEVNRRRLARIAQLFPPERETESRLNLSGFLGTVAQELNQRPYDVLRHWSLGEVFAQAAVAAQSARESREAADRAARDRRPS